MERYHDRTDAGRRLAQALASYRDHPDVLVLALPRGGVPVAYEVATALGAPLDVFLVRKLGVPGETELAMGAIAAGGIRVLNAALVAELGIGEDEIAAVTAEEERVIAARERLYRGDRPPPPVAGKQVIVVDDGLATGATMRAAVSALKPLGATRIVVAVPVAPRATCDTLRDEADEVACLLEPETFFAISQWYEDFSQTTDAEVRAYLERAAADRGLTPRRSDTARARPGIVSRPKGSETERLAP